MVNFENGVTPINDANLNKMQTDLLKAITDLKGTVLYENSAGANKDITLSEDASNFKYIEIFYRDQDGRNSSKKISNTTNAIVLDISVVGSSQVFISSAGINISGTSITWLWNRRADSWSSYVNDGEAIAIMKVVGYKEV